MTSFSAFTWFGGARFSSRKTVHQLYFELLTENQGGNYAEGFSSRQSARIFAASRCLASSQLMLDRAFHNANPLKTTELLPELEKEYGLIPDPDADLNQRRRELAARIMIARGASREAVQDALALVLGSDFLEYRTTQVSERVLSPTTLAGAVAQGTFTADQRIRKDIRIVPTISTGLGAPQVVSFVSLEPGAPLPELLAGEKLLVDPGFQRETVTITDVSLTFAVLEATFTKAHDANCPATTARVPIWASTQRHALMVLTSAAAQDPERRRKTNEVCRRVLRGISTWDICSDTGPFRVEVGLIGVTPIGAI